MKCPYCEFEKLGVLRSRHSLQGVTRRRVCARCGQRFTTVERIKREQLHVTKAGSRPAEPFEEEKLAGVILGVMKGFSVTKQDAESLAQDVRTALLASGKTIVSSAEVRNRLLSRLREVHPVAYRRFEALSGDPLDSGDDEGQYRLFASERNPPKSESN